MDHPKILGWGSFLLAHMYHEMHEVVYREGKSMEAVVLVLQICAWEHLADCRPIVDDAKDPQYSIVYKYSRYITQPHLGKIEYWR